MGESQEKFAELLTKAIYNIKDDKNRTIASIQDEIGYALGYRGGATIEHWRKGHLPPDTATMWNLAQALEERDGFDGTERTQFLWSMGLIIDDKPNPLPEDRLYIERSADKELKTQIEKRGSTTTIRAPSQAGKTSLLGRGISHARGRGYEIIDLDLVSEINNEELTSIDRFLHFLATSISDELKLDLDDKIKNIWNSPRLPNTKLTKFMAEHILTHNHRRLIFAIDEADRLLDKDFSKDFFGLLRSWHNNRAKDSRWNKLNLIMVISTEPYLLIPDPSQSPFNVGLEINLPGFTEEQVQDLNECYGSLVDRTKIPQVMYLLGSYPYLIRLAFDWLVTHESDWRQLEEIAASETGPFIQHLRRCYRLLVDKPELTEAFKEILAEGRCTNKEAYNRLLQAGLIKDDEHGCRCSCDLYRRFFQGKL